MAEINCGECARYRQPDCRPDVCNPNGAFDSNKSPFKLFLDPMSDPKKYCQHIGCGKRLLRVRTVVYSPEYREVDLECPVHGLRGMIKEQFDDRKG